MLSDFPKEEKEFINIDTEKEFDYLKEIISAIRNIRGEANVSPAKKIEVIFKTVDENAKNILQNNAKILDKLANVEKYKFDAQIPKLAGFRLVDTTEIYVPLADLIDLDKEIEKLEKSIEKVQKDLDRTLNKLSNKNFVKRAKPEAVEKEKRIKEELENKIAKLTESINLYK